MPSFRESMVGTRLGIRESIFRRSRGCLNYVARVVSQKVRPSATHVELMFCRKIGPLELAGNRFDVACLTSRELQVKPVSTGQPTFSVQYSAWTRVNRTVEKEIQQRHSHLSIRSVGCLPFMAFSKMAVRPASSCPSENAEGVSVPKRPNLRAHEKSRAPIPMESLSDQSPIPSCREKSLDLVLTEKPSRQCLPAHCRASAESERRTSSHCFGTQERRGLASALQIQKEWPGFITGVRLGRKKAEEPPPDSADDAACVVDHITSINSVRAELASIPLVQSSTDITPSRYT